ncbi:uncharacterized protein LOC128217270 isoform X2 [Mya arenaria]|uniref:uncharacterized protein LOC128217270 isoform X1 n=1 Tax=Mya arenaria TaxID=6604 RepID=UPI0022E20A13|nr:uncharacterized protein LOC128217270 isoform X1 [Mya arenaria]XP_052780262.1 uncharacterized protein LOC128217270 isoform X2 [Mya arenaria]
MGSCYLTFTLSPVLLLTVLLPLASLNEPVPLVNEFSIMAETAENNVANTLVKDSNIQRPSDDITSTMFTISEEVNNCYEGKCHACFMLWMFKGCIYLQKNPDGISVTIEFVGKSIFSKIIQEEGRFDIDTAQLPAFVRDRIDGRIALKVDDVLTANTLLCAQVGAEIKTVGWVRWPSSEFRCFKDARM